jgi:uracil-DNA glycosylase
MTIRQSLRNCPELIQLERELRSKPNLIPRYSEVFQVLNMPLEEVRVVIFETSPYYNSESHGYAWSTRTGVVPKTLSVVFSELLKSNLSVTKRKNGNLTDWVKQGVLLLNLNLALDYRSEHMGRYKELSHKVIAEVLKTLKELPQPIVFMPWGAEAIEMCRKWVLSGTKDPKLIISNEHPVLEVYGKAKFTGKNDFIRANEFLLFHRHKPIQWDTRSSSTTP